MYLLTFWADFTALKWQISLGLFFDKSQLVDFLPFHLPEAWQMYPFLSCFRAEPPI